MSQYDPAQLLPRIAAAGGDGCIDKSRLSVDLLPTIKRILMQNAASVETPALPSLQQPKLVSLAGRGALGATGGPEQEAELLAPPIMKS